MFHARFAELPIGRDAISGWFRRGLEAHDRPDRECFEPFIYAWFAFNAWAEAVTDQETDWKWVSALARDVRLSDAFADRISGAGVVGTWARRFHEYWPVPQARSYRLLPAGQQIPQQIANRVRLFDHKGIKYRPECCTLHCNRPEEVPLDWEHFIWAAYQVRCNLFHGAKSLHNTVDQIVVASTCRALVGFLDGLDNGTLFRGDGTR